MIFKRPKEAARFHIALLFLQHWCLLWDLWSTGPLLGLGSPGRAGAVISQREYNFADGWSCVFHNSFYFFLWCWLLLASLEICSLPPRGAWVPLCSPQKLPAAVVCGKNGLCLRFFLPISLSVLDCDPECFQRKSLFVSLQISLSSIVAMEIRKPSLAGEFVWLWTGSGTEDTPTSKFLSRPGGKSHQDLIPLSEVCSVLR